MSQNPKTQASMSQHDVLKRLEKAFNQIDAAFPALMALPSAPCEEIIGPQYH